MTPRRTKSSDVRAPAWLALTATRAAISVRVLMARFVFFVIVIELPRGAGGGGALS
jgi:hypothetical protein